MTSKNYRKNVAAIILSSSYPLECKLFIAQRVDIKEAWQFPQGGIDKNETPKIALLRELKEEIGTDNIDILSEYPEWISYDFPLNIAQKMRPYDGQIQKYFLVRLRSEAKINLDTKEPEFKDYKFIKVDEALEMVSHFKKPVYTKVIKYFKEEGYI